jgi:hypothetical protein
MSRSGLRLNVNVQRLLCEVVYVGLGAVMPVLYRAVPGLKRIIHRSASTTKQGKLPFASH